VLPPQVCSEVCIKVCSKVCHVCSKMCSKVCLVSRCVVNKHTYTQTHTHRHAAAVMNGLAHSTIRDTPLLHHLARIVASYPPPTHTPLREDAIEGQGVREGGDGTLGGGVGDGGGGEGGVRRVVDGGDGGGVSVSVSPSPPGLDTQSLSLCLHALAVLNGGGGGDGRTVLEAVVRRIVISDWRLHSSAGLANIAWAAAVLQLPGSLHREIRGWIFEGLYWHTADMDRYSLNQV
jgi:hypothetical protein